jgi:hypothetical protein
MRTLRLATVATVVAVMVGMATPVMGQGEYDRYAAGTFECEPAGPIETAMGETVGTASGPLGCHLTMSDKRVTGAVDGLFHSACFMDAADHCVLWGTMELAGPRGEWRGAYRGVSDVADFETATVSAVLQGTDGYAGWTFIAQLRGPDLAMGVVYEGLPPPLGPRADVLEPTAE